MRFPAEQYVAVFDGVGFLSLVALNRRLDQRGIDDLPAVRHLAVLVRLLLELLEDLVTDTSLGQAVTEQRDRLSARDAAAVR
jgi:hypothetical protein